MTFEHGAGPRLRTQQLEKALGVGPRWDDVQAWSGPLLRTFVEGERQHVERRAWRVEFWTLEVRPAVRVCGWGLGPDGGGLRGGLRGYRWGPGWGRWGGAWTLHSRREAPRAED